MGEVFPRVALADVVGPDGRLIGGPFGSSLGRRDYVSAGVPVVRGVNLQERIARFDDAVFVTESKADSLARCVGLPGDVAITQRGTLGQVALLPDVFGRYLISQSQMAVRADGSVVRPDFLLLAMRSADFAAQIRNEAITTGVPHLNLGILKRLEVALPPLVEQRAIAGVLGAVDHKIESNRRLADAADDAWLHFASSATSGATSVQVEALIGCGVLAVNDGYRAKNSELASAGLPFIRAKNLTPNGLELADADRLPVDTAAHVGIKRTKPWDTAFTSKGTVGRITLVSPDTQEAVYSPQVCFWRSLDFARLSPFVLHAWMMSPRFKAQIDSVKGQTDMADYVSLRDQRAMVIDLPAEPVQRTADEFARPLARHASVLRCEARTLTALRDALLPKLVSGKIRVPLSRDPDEQIAAATEAIAQ